MMMVTGTMLLLQTITEALEVQYKSGSYLEIVPGIGVTAGINVTDTSAIAGIDDSLRVYLGYDADGDTLIGNAEDEVAGEVQLGPNGSEVIIVQENMTSSEMVE